MYMLMEEWVAPGGDSAPKLESIGLGLGRHPRFAGQTRRPYNVLAHSFVVASFLLPEHRVHGLLHDAGEAVLGDIPTDWKTEADREREGRLMARIYKGLGLEAPHPIVCLAVKEADKRALSAEATLLLPKTCECAPEFAIRHVGHWEIGHLDVDIAALWIERCEEWQSWQTPDGHWVRWFVDAVRAVLPKPETIKDHR